MDCQSGFEAIEHEVLADAVRTSNAVMASLECLNKDSQSTTTCSSQYGDS
jgi:hypothetical protein